MEQNKDKNQAVALNFNPSENDAPKVIAKGKGIIADNIIDIAKQNGIPVYKNQALSAMLMLVELDCEIPPELYHAVAEVLVYVYSIDKKIKIPK